MVAISDAGWCDSSFTWHIPDTANRYTCKELSEEVINKCKENNCNNVIITGGNPCLHDLTQLVNILQENDIHIGIETQGEPIPDWVEQVNTLVFSPKPPSSGQKDTYDNIVNYIMNGIYTSEQTIAIKIPVFNNEDIEFARTFSKFVNYYTDTYKATNIKMYLSVGNTNTTEVGSIQERILSCYEQLINIINENPESFENVYILPQVHTLIWRK